MKDVCFEPKFDFTFPDALTKLCCINIALTKSDNCMNECQSGKKNLISFTISVQYRTFQKTRGLIKLVQSHCVVEGVSVRGEALWPVFGPSIAHVDERLELGGFDHVLPFAQWRELRSRCAEKLISRK